MPFARSHLYLSIHWRPSAYPSETGQCGIRFDNPTASVSQALVDACKVPVSTLWSTVAARIPNDHALMFVRLARIAADGHYVAGTSSFDGTFGATGVTGSGGIRGNPLQVACATTLTTDVPHGQASKGRIFLPALNVSPTTAGDDLWTVADVNARSTAVAAMITSLNTVLGGNAAIFSQGSVRSAVPVTRSVTGVVTGRRADVQRRRAKGVPDVKGGPISVTLVPPQL